MLSRKTDLRIKIISLADEARTIRRYENKANYEAFKLRSKSLVSAKYGGPLPDMPEELQNELGRRVTPAAERAYDAGERGMQRAQELGNRVAKKVIRKFIRDGFSKEQILAMPGVAKSLRYTAKAADLRQHRTGIVRHESRHSQLAYAFLRGKPYCKTEDKACSYPNWDKVQKIAQRFSEEDSRVVAQRFEQWRQEAHTLIRGNDLMKPKRHFKQEPFQVAA